MSSYPLPGERIARTLRNVDFGRWEYEPDEPAPPEVAAAVLAVQEAEQLAWSAHQIWMRDVRAVEARRSELIEIMSHFMHKSYLCNGRRVRLVVEADGCRRRYVEIKEISR